ncbi:MAG: glutamine-hydrolyzing GMP synthase [bacterium]|nr:glutamine-hydrolyzing GMP synthase [bacterium]
MSLPAEGASRDHPVLVVDFGAQYAQLIARRVREAHIYSEIVPHTISANEITERQPGAVIFSGGPKSVHIEGSPRIDPDIYRLGIPILGICYGAQLIAAQLGGEVSRTGIGEYGRTAMTVRTPSLLFGPDEDETAADDGRQDPDTLFGPEEDTERPVWMSHFDSISTPPDGFVVTASTPQAPVAALEHPNQRIFGVQFHPEVAHTPGGQAVLERFLYQGAGLAPSWTTESFIDEAVAAIRAQIGGGRAVCGLSGGVDSAVAAALVHRAVGHQLTCVFVDTGLMRQDEGQQVIDAFRRSQGIELIAVDAADRFFDALVGVIDPEEKRKIIGELFIRIFEEAANQVDGAAFLVQGTLYPDVIESGSDSAAKIKSHHNVGGIPEEMDFELVEPLRDLFKDEVRAVGHELGLPDEIVWRHPFPGPGLGVRVIGEVTPSKAALLAQADAIVRAEITAAGVEREVWQAFAVLPDIRTVGVMGDERTYGQVVVIRAVTSEDAMTADWARLPYELLEKMSSRIINEVDGINRVAYDITSKPPGTIEWE